MKTTQTIKQILLVIALLPFMTACDNYLDITPKGSQLLTTAEDYAALMNNEVTSILFPSDEIRLVSDNTWGSAVLLRQYNSNSFNLVNLAFCADEVKPRDSYYSASSGGSLFTACYVHINRVANLILDNIDNATGSEELKARTKAEAQIVRAYNYFMLINVYAKHYDKNTAAADGGVPFVDKLDPSASPRQAPVAEIYQFIEDDIRKAIESGALSNTPEGPYHPSKAMAYALKAKVHLFKKEWALAKEAALESYNLNNYVFDMITFVTSQRGTKIYANDRENLYYALAQGEFSGDGGGLGSNALISAELRDLYDPRIPANTDPAKLPKDFNPKDAPDVRYAGWFDYTTTAAGTNQDQDYIPARSNATNDYCINTAGMRTTEVILMLAELEAREGNFTEMNTYLDKVRSKRIKGYVSETYIPANWVEAVKIVMTERRKELTFGFNRFFDVRRLNTEPEFKAPFTRIAPANPNIGQGGSSLYYHDLDQKAYTITPDSRWWITLFPRSEMERNKNLKQNIDR